MLVHLDARQRQEVVDEPREVVKKSGELVEEDSDEEIGDFELRAEFYVADDSNSGIHIRCDDSIVRAGASVLLVAMAGELMAG